tara:strand:+ start:1251 stop:1667 length:417 start_codon:yes stop_codon:yes gene_type:complete
MYYKTVIKHKEQDEQGLLKEIKEQHLVESVSYTDAETRIFEIMLDEGFSSPEVVGITKTKFAQVLVDIDSDENSIYFQGVISFVSIDDNGKQKKIKEPVLIYCKSIERAMEYLKDELKEFAVPVEIEAITKTAIIDIH